MRRTHKGSGRGREAGREEQPGGKGGRWRRWGKRCPHDERSGKRGWRAMEGHDGKSAERGGREDAKIGGRAVGGEGGGAGRARGSAAGRSGGRGNRGKGRKKMHGEGGQWVEKSTVGEETEGREEESGRVQASEKKGLGEETGLQAPKAGARRRSPASAVRDRGLPGPRERLCRGNIEGLFSRASGRRRAFAAAPLPSQRSLCRSARGSASLATRASSPSRGLGAAAAPASTQTPGVPARSGHAFPAISDHVSAPLGGTYA